MDERRSLALLGWTVGGIVGLMFVLNAIALSLVQGGPPTTRLFVAHADRSLEPTANWTLTAAKEKPI